MDSIDVGVGETSPAWSGSLNFLVVTKQPGGGEVGFSGFARPTPVQWPLGIPNASSPGSAVAIECLNGNIPGISDEFHPDLTNPNHRRPKLVWQSTHAHWGNRTQIVPNKPKLRVQHKTSI